jgi:hypothetical protein
MFCYILTRSPRDRISTTNVSSDPWRMLLVLYPLVSKSQKSSQPFHLYTRKHPEDLPPHRENPTKYCPSENDSYSTKDSPFLVVQKLLKLVHIYVLYIPACAFLSSRGETTSCVYTVPIETSPRSVPLPPPPAVIISRALFSLSYKPISTPDGYVSLPGIHHTKNPFSVNAVKSQMTALAAPLSTDTSTL